MASTDLLSVSPNALILPPQHRVIFDSGTSFHFTPRRDFFAELHPLAEPGWVKGALGQPVWVAQHGRASIPLGQYTLVLEDVLL